jgi:hypothetical protein
MKRREMPVRVTLFVLLFVPVWFIPSEALSADRGWPRFYVEPSFTLLDRDLVEGAYTVAANGPKLVAQGSPSVLSIRLLTRIGAELTPNIELYGLIGGSSFHIDDFNFQSGLVAAYGGGARLKLQPGFYPERRLTVFLDYQFLTYQAERDGIAFDPIGANGRFVFVDSSNNPVYETASEKITWQEHVIKVGASGRQDFFEPYGGFQISFLDTSHEVTSQAAGAFPANHLNLHIRGDRFFGLFAGTYVYLNPRESTALFLEAHVQNETSITVGLRVNF